MGNLKKKFIFEISVFVLLTGSLAGGIFFFKTKVQDYSVKVRDVRHNIDRESIAIDRLTNLQKIYNEKAKSYLGVLYNVLPKKDELINLSRDLQIMAQAEGLDFGFSFSGERAASDNAPGSVEFSLHLKGQTRENILKFLGRLRSFRYSNEIASVNIALDGSGDVNAGITGRVFFRP